MIYVGQKVLAEDEEYTVGVTTTDNGGIVYTLNGDKGQRRLNDFGAMQMEVVNREEEENEKLTGEK